MNNKNNSNDHTNGNARGIIWNPPGSDESESIFDEGGSGVPLDNKEINNAMEISIGVPVSGGINGQCFKFTTTQSGAHTIYTLEDLDATLRLYNSNGILLVAVNDDDNDNDDPVIIARSLSANATYYIKVNLRNGATGDYTLKVVTGVSDGSENEDILVSALCTKEDCYVRLDTIINNTTNDTRLKTSSGGSVVLRANTADTVRLLQSSKITDNSEDWYQILYDGMIAYVTADSFDVTTMPKPIFYSVKNVIVNTGENSNLNVRNKPYLSGELLGQFADQTIIQLMNLTPQNGNWYPVYGQLNDGTYSYGWCSGEYLRDENQSENNPSDDNNNGNYQDFLQALAIRESSNSYTAVSGSHLGKYQMGPPALQDAGFMDENNDWTPLAKSYNVNSQNDFLYNAEAQEVAVVRYHKKIWDYIVYYNLIDKVGQIYQNVKITESGLVAAIHLIGIGDIITAINNNTCVTDGNGTTASDYMNHMANYDMSEIK